MHLVQYSLDCLSQASYFVGDEGTGRMSEQNPARPTVVSCASGYRSSIGSSVLAAAGFDDVSDLLGGYDAWKAQHHTGREKEPTA